MKTHWLEVARDVVARKSFQFVDAETGAIVGPKRTAEAWREAERREDEPEKPLKPATVALDMTTAQLLVTVYDALNESNRAKFVALPLAKAVSVAWRLVK